MSRLLTFVRKEMLISESKLSFFLMNMNVVSFLLFYGLNAYAVYHIGKLVMCTRM